MIRGRIIQIATSAWAFAHNDGDCAKQTLFALCEDGTLWARQCDAGPERWIEIPTPTREARKLAEAAANR